MQYTKTCNSPWQVLLLSVYLMVSGQSYAAQSITFYHNDILGSPVATTDENGNICWREDYQPYGEKLKNDDGYEPSTAGCGLDDNQRGYTGHVFDKDIGLTYMQARYYDPIVGRFMGVDPVGPRLDNQVSFNRYACGNNNPYKFVDPDGMESDDGPGGDFGDPLGWGPDANSARNDLNKGMESLQTMGHATVFVNEVTDYAPSPKSFLSRLGKKLFKKIPKGTFNQKLFHFTQSSNADAIMKGGIRPGASGKAFTTPQGNLSPLQAQIDLAMPPNRGLPDALFEIDVGKLKQLGVKVPAPSQVGRSFNLPGGGLEVPIGIRIPLEALRL